MPRKPREFVEHGIYHVFNRGNNRHTLFEKNNDFERFKAILRAGLRRESIRLFHYCLMTNHFHLLLQNNEKESLPKFMHWIQLGYARYYKETYVTTGHILEERYRSLRIEEDSYYLQCGRYIERNPVKAGLVKNPEDYAHSSTRHYVFGKKDELVTENIHYKSMGYDEKERQRKYREFVRIEEPYAELVTERLVVA